MDKGFKVGDKVKIIDPGYAYTKYEGFHKKYKENFVHEFENGKLPEENDTGIISVIDKHMEYGITTYDTLAIVNTNSNSYIMSIKGLRKLEPSKLRVDLNVHNIVKEERYYLETNLGRVDITDMIKDVM